MGCKSRSMTKSPANWRGCCLPKTFAADESGATSTVVALSMIVLMGMAGLGFDATIWYKDKRDIQSVADLTVLSALHEKLAGKDLNQMTAAAVTHAERNGFVDGEDGSLTINSPPESGPNKDIDGFVEVEVALQRRLSFASLFLGDEITIRARAVAGTQDVGDNCVLALDHSAPDALNVTGNASVISSCGIASNSLSDTSIHVQGSGYVEVSSAQAFGDVVATMLDSPGGGAGLYASDPNQALSVRLADPYADTEIPVDPDCDVPNKKSFSNETLNPGVYCGGGMDLKKNITLNEGVYVIYGGDLSMNGNADVEATGPVTFIFTHSDPAEIGGVNKINGNTEVELSAPGPDGHESGDYQGKYAGLLMIQDPRVDSGYTNVFNGGADMNFSGAIYSASAKIDYRGGSDTAPGCVQLVARTIKFTGNVGFGNTPEACDTQGVEEITQQRARLSE